MAKQKRVLLFDTTIGTLQIQGLVRAGSVSPILPFDPSQEIKLRRYSSAVLTHGFEIQWIKPRLSFMDKINILRNSFEFAQIGPFANTMGMASSTLRAYLSPRKHKTALPMLKWGNQHIVDLQSRMPELINCDQIKSQLANKMGLLHNSESELLRERAGHLRVQMMEIVDEIEGERLARSQRLAKLKTTKLRLPLIPERRFLEEEIKKKYLIDPIQVGAVAFVLEEQFGSVPEGITKLEINGYKGFGALELEFPGIYGPFFSTPITPMCQKFSRVF